MVRSKILIVDDSITNVYLMEGVLNREGYEVVGASNGKEALVVASKELPNLILLDLMMPFVDGFAFLERIKQDPQLKDIPVIVVSAKNDASDKEKILELGAIAYMDKPVKINKLIGMIKNEIG